MNYYTILSEVILNNLFNAEIEKIIEIDMTRSEHVRRWWPFLRDRRIDAYSGLTKRFLD